MRQLAMLRLKNLTKVYDLPSDKQGHVVAADRLNLEVPPGEIFGLVGPNGAGKTTTLKMICGLLIPTAGCVTVNGINVERQPEEVQRYIGYLADFFSLYDDLKVWEYLHYFAHAYKMDPFAIQGRLDEIVRILGLEAKRNAMVGGLSRGMKQRLAIGRAIIHDPPLLVLDEPAAGLDPKARVELKQLLREENRRGKTIFVTSHVLSDLEEICTSLAIMERGRLLRVGRLEQVMREAHSSRRFRIKLATPGFALGDWFAGQPGTSGVTAEATSAAFAFHGSDADLSELLRGLVLAGAPVCSLEEIVETLEQLFSRLSSGEVM